MFNIISTFNGYFLKVVILILLEVIFASTFKGIEVSIGGITNNLT